MRLAALGAPLALGLGGCYLSATYSDLIDGPRDGAADVGPTATPAAFCPPADSGQLVYCTDFDGLDPSLGLGTGSADAGIVRGTQLAPPSPPGALLVTTYAQGAFGSYTVSFPGVDAATVTLDFEMRVLAVGAGFTAANIGLVADLSSVFQVLNVEVSAEGAYGVQELERPADGGAAVTAGHGGDATSSPNAGDGAWHHLVLVLSLAASGAGSSKLTVDGTAVDGEPLALAWAPGSASVTIGTTYSTAGGDEVAFDNVRATVTP